MTEDLSKNPNADVKAARRIQGELSQKFLEIMQTTGVELAGVAADVPDFYRRLYSAFAISVLTVQAATEEDKTMTVDEHMRNQFGAARAAFKSLAEVNAAIWHEPPKLERKK